MPLLDPDQARQEQAADHFARLCKSQGIKSTTSDAAIDLALRMAMEAVKIEDDARRVLECILHRNNDVLHYAELLFETYEEEYSAARELEAHEKREHERIESAMIHI